MKKWAISFHELISDPTGQRDFCNFLNKEFSQENLFFWQCVENYKYCPRSRQKEKMNDIYR